ncbi:MAG: ATP-dependent zinc metalloprotease FtsH [Verrucomicrobia subdivision 3 bacterium]|nr:ATP-dependent zinc metalloprotease FtsH [Limisphaerales bacterium]
MNGRDSQSKGPNPPGNQWRYVFVYVILVMFMLWFWQEAITRVSVRTMAYSEFKEHLARGEVLEVNVSPDFIQGKIRYNAATATNAPPAKLKDKSFMFRAVRVEDPKLVEELQAAKVKITGTRPNVISQVLLAWILPIAIILLIWSFISRRLAGASQSVFGFGKSKARLIAERESGVTFKDVAGCDEAKFELQEVVDFLKNPDKYKSLGAKIPKGVLLVGPPGTGKTLLARAVAGEARVPFFSISGSDFVEMFVGVGAARVRDMFQQAKAQAPCIIFIDELDAIGRQRGVHVGAVNDEREQTLNQLLVELDGFTANVGVIVLAATNRPEVLDRALLRPGRFDRQVVVDAPDVDGREAILKVHARNKPLDDNVDLRRIAQATPGFSGADLANALNEAALLAARRNSKRVQQGDIEEAVEKVIAGPERKSRKLLEEKKRRVAYHEVGHALVAAYSRYADPVHKISVVPRGHAALGYTLQLPTEDQFLMTRAEILDRIRGILGGRAAEEIVFQDVSTGAENDLDRATSMARQMVCMFGMSDTVGLAHYGQKLNPFGLQQDALQRDCSEVTAREIDTEVKKILDRSYTEAKEVLSVHRDQLERVTSELLRGETLDRATFYRLLGKEEPPIPRAISTQETAPDREPAPAPAGKH